MKLGKGLRRDSHDHPWRKRQRDARNLLGSTHIGATRAPGTLVSLRSFEKHTYDQISSQGCTGHSVAFGVETHLNAIGAPLDFDPSPGDPYKLGRCIGRVLPTIALVDDGAMLADVAQAISTWGMRPIGPLNPRGYTDVTPDNVNVEPNLLELEQDAKALVVGEYRVDLGALTLIDDVCALLDAKVPLWSGGPVGPKYEDFIASAAPVGAEPAGDGHATVITGYKVLTAEKAELYGLEEGEIVFENKTSWGAFGDEGHVWVTRDWLRSMWDCYSLAVTRAA